MNTDTSLLLLVAEQHATIMNLRNENEALRRSLEASGEQETNTPAEDKSEKKPSGKTDKG